ncbi:MAG: Gfo/Idh/MocA family oxidoreductase, partial [Armatimonadetes bacterium]|nr:Gfo/Idh/MocA family oxidoreductase [Armatimonadota bacterium]
IWPATVTRLTDLYELVAMAEPVPERAEANRERWQVPVYEDLETMLSEQGPDVVLAATPTDAYYIVAVIAARHGCHVISEIPLAATRAIADLAIKAAADAGVKLEVAENVFRWASERLKQKIIEQGFIGKPLHARLWYTCGAYHGFNAIRALLGADPTAATGFCGTIAAPYYLDYLDQTIPDRLWESAVVEFGEDAVCLYEKPPYGPRGNLWEVEGTAGALLHDELWLDDGAGGQRFPFVWEWTEVDGQRVLDHVRVETEPPVVWENPFRDYFVADNDEVARVDILTSFHRAITEDAPVAYPPEKEWPDQEAWIALRESARRGSRRVEMPLTERTAFEAQMEAEYLTLYGHPYDDIDRLAKVPFRRGGVRWTVGREL